MITIYLEHRSREFEFDVNPANLKISQAGNNETEQTIGQGEINILKSPALRTTEIQSFVHDDPEGFLKFIKRARRSKKPCRLIVTELDINMLVGIDGFEHETRAAEEEDLYITLELQEWKDYSPQLVSSEEEPQAIKTRIESPPQPDKTYTVKYGDTLWGIAKRYTGNGMNFKQLHAYNRGVVDPNPNVIYVGWVLKIPPNWRSD